MVKRYYFYLILGLLGLISGGFQWLMFRHAGSAFALPEALYVFLLAPLTFVVPYTMERYLPLPVSKLLARVGGYWFIFAFYATMLLIPFFVLWCACVLFCGAAVWEPVSRGYAIAALGLLVFLLIIGAWRACHPVRRVVTVVTEKNIPRNFTVAFASDIHLGMVLDGSFSRRLVNDINAIAPNFVLFGGDLIDGNLGFVLKDGSFESFRKLSPELGSYAVFGNHDWYGMDIPLERKVLEGCGIKCLQGESISPEDGISILGMEDYLFHPEQKVRPVSDSVFSIVIDHEPVRMEEAMKTGHDLYLGGHTHAGQFWPVSHFTGKMFDLDYGTMQTGKFTAIVSSGYGAWGTLFRLGTKPEIVVVHVRKASKRVCV